MFSIALVYWHNVGTIRAETAYFRGIDFKISIIFLLCLTRYKNYAILNLLRVVYSTAFALSLFGDSGGVFL